MHLRQRFFWDARPAACGLGNCQQVSGREHGPRVEGAGPASGLWDAALALICIFMKQGREAGRRRTQRVMNYS